MDRLKRISTLVNNELEYSSKHNVDTGGLKEATIVKGILDVDTSDKEKLNTLIGLKLLLEKGLRGYGEE